VGREQVIAALDGVADCSLSAHGAEPYLRD